MLITNVAGRPAAWAVHLVSRVNQLRGFVGRIAPPARFISERPGPPTLIAAPWDDR